MKIIKKLVITTLIITCFAGAAVLVSPSSPIPSSDNSPNITHAEASPYKVQVGDILTITAEIEDSFGIDKVMADMAGIDVIELRFVEDENAVAESGSENGSEFGSVPNFGTVPNSGPTRISPKKGTWQGQWRVYNTLAKTYTTTITATNIKGFSAEREVKWEDPADWLTDYDYRKAIVVDNTSGGALSDYQVKVENPIYDETGLVGSWHFEEATVSNGVTVADSSGQGNTGTYTSDNGAAEKSTADGKHDRGLTFDGTGDYVSAADSTDWAFGTSSFTFELWSNLDTLTQDDWWQAAFIGHSDGSGTVNKWYFSYDDATDKLLVHINSPANENIIIRSDVLSLSAGVWYHFALVRSSNDWNFYKDGVMIGSVNQAGTLHDATAPLNIGWGEGAGTGFDGSIDEVKIYNRALSASEIKAHYEAKAKLNYGDVRFTDENGGDADLIDHWAEKDGTYWVEVPSISASLNKTIYMYYGKSDATTASNGDATFIQWHGTATADFVDSYDVNPINTIYEGRVRTTSTPFNVNWFLKNTIPSDWTDSHVTIGTVSTTNDRTAACVKDGVDTQSTESPCLTLNQWYKIKWTQTASNVHFYVDGDEIGAGITTNIPTESLGLGMREHDGHGEQEWSLVRKYAATEPTIYTYAEQENLVFANRKAITISGSGSVETDYQVKLLIGKTATAVGEEFHLDGNCKDKFGDIRFGDSNGNTYSYWIESVSGTGAASLATVWVKVPSIPAAGTVIYIYYNNAVASDASNGDATFEFFDDFSGDLSKWTIESGTWAIIGGELRYTGVGVSTSEWINASSMTNLADQEVIAEIKWGTDSADRGGILARYSDSNNFYALIGHVSTPDLFRIEERVAGTWGTLDSAAQGYDAATWYSFKFQLCGTSLKGWIDGGNERNAVDGSHTTGKIALRGNSPAGQYVYYDNIRIRKYTATEPAYSSVATAEAGSYNANKWHYRVAITINSSSALYNYQVKLDDVDTATLISAGKMNSDCSDIRFASTDDFDENDWTASYPYWIESGCNSATTDIWVRADALANSANNVIYMYYSNPSAIPATNGDATFEFFDDCSGSVVSDKYDIAGGLNTGDFSYSGGEMITIYDARNKILPIKNTYSISDDCIMECDLKVEGGASVEYIGIAMRWIDSTHYYQMYSADNGHSYIFDAFDSVFTDVSTGIATDTWYEAKGIVKGSDLEWYPTGSLIVERTDATHATGRVGLFSYRGITHWDNIRVRKYTATEPSASMGNEGVPRIFGSPIISPSGGGMMSF